MPSRTESLAASLRKSHRGWKEPLWALLGVQAEVSGAAIEKGPKFQTFLHPRLVSESWALTQLCFLLHLSAEHPRTSGVTSLSLTFLVCKRPICLLADGSSLQGLTRDKDVKDQRSVDVSPLCLPWGLAVSSLSTSPHLQGSPRPHPDPCVTSAHSVHCSACNLNSSQRARTQNPSTLDKAGHLTGAHGGC